MTHTHQHHHPHQHASDHRAFVWGVILNTVFVAAEAWYGWTRGSLALLADAGHNLSDILGLLLAWGGLWMSQRRPDRLHTYGWQRVSILAALANALILFFAMAAMVWAALQRLGQPMPWPGETVMQVAAIGILVNGVSAWLFLTGDRHDVNIRGAFLHMAGDALVSLGVVLGGGLYLMTGWVWLDPVLGLVIAALVLASAWRLFRESLHLAFDGVPSDIDPGAVNRQLAALPGVVEVHDLHIWPIGSAETAMTVHLVMPSGHPGDDFIAAIAEAMHETFAIAHVTVQIELGNGKTACGLQKHTA